MLCSFWGGGIFLGLEICFIYLLTKGKKAFTYPFSPGLVIILFDISHRKRMEKEQSRLIHTLQEKNLQLTEALEGIKSLKGIIPICASCKKIRDDKGYWNQVDQYIQQHTDAKFSHSMCPECNDKLYGNQDWYIKMKEKKNDTQ